ncbi:hypothetical protein CHELV3228_0640 [Campylobacter helveticus]|nr:hypothetical protein CHELV3228_0640 [Campylobacter helveticus]
MKTINLEHYPKSKKVLQVMILIIAVCISLLIAYFMIIYFPFYFVFNYALNEEQQTRLIELYNQFGDSAIFTLCLSFLWIAFYHYLHILQVKIPTQQKSKTTPLPLPYKKY